ncbi:hypothetical protein HZH68_011672 [Vespula germanica]|uniref:Uncharacterized protein n=1 Tax=Vespula germanica TaxID=30212 RepID=A0A834JKQ2_VESGE|nr:hypothetical protein HZH68_011672 [Vespula germanica]
MLDIRETRMAMVLVMMMVLVMDKSVCRVSLKLKSNLPDLVELGEEKERKKERKKKKELNKIKSDKISFLLHNDICSYSFKLTKNFTSPKDFLFEFLTLILHFNSQKCIKMFVNRFSLRDISILTLSFES